MKQTICGACGEPWTGQKCEQFDNAHPFLVCFPYQTEDGDDKIEVALAAIDAIIGGQK